MEIVYLNGSYLPRTDAVLSVEDRGFVFGDGVYEVIPTFRGVPFLMAAHLSRLSDGLRALAIDYSVGEVESIFANLIAENGLDVSPMSIFYLQVTRGAAPRAHHFPPAGTKPTVFATARVFSRPAFEVWEKGVSAITHPDYRWGRADIKTIQLLPNVMAQEAARSAGASDAIFVRDGIPLEGGHNNLFFVFGERIRTHPTSNQILPGVTRAVVIELARELGYVVEEGPTSLQEMSRTSELFLTGSTSEVRPVVSVDGRPVGDGRVGAVSRALYAALLKRIERECGSPQ
jgi:D-alanine transaminase